MDISCLSSSYLVTPLKYRQRTIIQKVNSDVAYVTQKWASTAGTSVSAVFETMWENDLFPVGYSLV